MNANDAAARIEEYKRIARVFGTPDGFEVLQALREVYMDQASYRPGGSVDDALFREGQRSVIAEIMNAIELGQNPPAMADLVSDEEDEEEDTAWK